MPTPTFKPEWRAAEQAVIASCLSNENAYPACKFLTPNDFGDARHTKAWRIIQDLARRQKPINQLSVWIESQHPSNAAGQRPNALSYSYLTKLVEDLPTAVGCHYYAEKVREHAEQRRLMAAGHVIASAAEQGALDVGDLKAKAAALVKGRNRFGGGVPL